MTPEQQKMVDSKLYTRQPAGEPPVRSSELVRRHVVSVSVCGVENNSSTQCNWITTVICNDGAIYWIRDNDAEWRELPPIPQPPNDQAQRSAPEAGGERKETHE